MIHVVATGVILQTSALELKNVISMLVTLAIRCFGSEDSERIDYTTLLWLVYSLSKRCANFDMPPMTL